MKRGNKDESLQAIHRRMEKKKGNEFNYIDGFMFKNIKTVAFISIEWFHHSFFHFIDTVKVRGQSRNMVHDVGKYFKNAVVDKPVISGLVSGFLGGFSGALTFILTFNRLTQEFYTNEKYQHWDFKKKNYWIFIASDFTACFARIFFETRKQLIQMWNKNIQVSQIMRGWYLGLTPMIMRDLLFRSTLLSVFYGTQYVEQSSELKFTLSEMIEYIRYCREVKGEEDATIQSKMHLFMEHHNYEIKTPMNIRFVLMLFANLVGTLITNPIDVWMTKILTQQERKYTGLINWMRTVYKEEGAKKFLAGIHPRFMFNSINGMLFLYFYDQVITTFYQLYDEENNRSGI